MTPLLGPLFDRVRIAPSPWVTLGAKRQFRFPRSKKKRIRKKWAKQAKNFRWDPRASVAYTIGDTMYVHMSVYDKIKEKHEDHRP